MLVLVILFLTMHRLLANTNFGSEDPEFEGGTVAIDGELISYILMMSFAHFLNIRTEFIPA